MVTQMESALTAVTGALTAELSLANIATVVVKGLGVALPLIVGWFGIRYVIGKMKKAFKRGN